MVHNLDADWLTNRLTHTHTRTHTHNSGAYGHQRTCLYTNNLDADWLTNGLTHTTRMPLTNGLTHHLDADGSPADVYTQLVCRWFPMGLTLFTKADFT